MNFFKYLKIIICILFLASLNVNAQYVQKRAGVCFRVDDNHSKQEFQQYASVFDNYGFKFCYALNLGLVNPTDTGFINTIDTLIAHGHEMMDHTPNHITKYFTVRSLADTVPFSMNIGVDHINQTKICLKIDSIHTNTYGDEGPVVVNGNMVISILPGEFKNFDDGSLQCIYLPAINKLCAFYTIYNKNVNDPDTIYLKTYWDEPFTLPNTITTAYKKIGLTDVFLNKTAIFNLLSQTTKYSNEFHFPPPTTWIQPGGYHPRLSQNQIKNACNLVGYNAAGINLDPAKKCFDEYNPYKTRRFSFQGEDFSSETQTFKTIKTRISDGIAKNKVQMEINHFGYYAPSSLLGGWAGYIQRMDSILSWCHNKNIPVENYRYWVPLLYDSIPNPYQNVFPSLSTDLDGDTYPDGFNKTNFGTMFTTGGVQSSNGYYINMPVSGYLCTISSLCGIEKGINHLEFYTQGGNTNNSLYVRVSYDQSNISETYVFSANSSFWEKQKIDFNCPDSISTISVTFSSFNVNSNVKLSGITLRKKSIISALPDTTIFTTFDTKFKSISLKTRVNDPFFNKDSLSFSIVKTTGLTTSIDSLKNLIVSKPTPFWKGFDAVWVKVQNPDESTDTLKILFKAIPPVFCKGDTIVLNPNFSITPSQVIITSTPSDSTLIPKSFGLFNDVPNQTTRYFIKEIMPLGNIVSDSIDIAIVAMQQPNLSIIGNNPFCSADSIQITASPNYYKTKWYCNDTLISGSDTLASYHTSKSGDYYAIQYDQNGCKNNSAILTIEKYPKLEFNINADTTVCINIDSLQLLSLIANYKLVSWSTSGDGILTVLPNQNLIYHPGIFDRTNGSTILSVIVEGIGNCSLVNDSIKIFYTPIPTKPSTPSGLDSLCINSPNSVFTCNGSSNSIYSQWTITPEIAGTINNSGISYALIDWNNSFSGKAFLSVQAVNQCGISSSSDTLTVKIIPIPEKADLPTGSSQICQSSTDQTLTTSGSPNASHYQWNIIPANAANFTGNGNTTVAHWNNGFIGTAAITVQGINNCGIGAISDTFSLIISPLPTKPDIPLGQTQLCINSNNSFYTTSGSNYASAYQWNIYPEAAGVIIDSSATTFINWDSAFFGIAKLTVKGTNECGSKTSDTLTIKIDPLPEKPSIPSGLDILCNNSANTNYSTIVSSYATSYNWNIYPANAGIINNLGATTIINWNNYYTGIANISVKEVNNCGAGDASDSLTITINSLPSNPIITNGPVSVKTDTALFSSYTAYSNYSDSIIWWIEPSEAANLTSLNSICNVYWASNFSGDVQLKLKAISDCGYSDSTIVFNVTILTAIGIENNMQMRLTVFPNPTNNGKFTIMSHDTKLQKGALIEITDNLGRKVYENILRENNSKDFAIETDISSFGKGIYFLRIGEITRKIVYR